MVQPFDARALDAKDERADIGVFDAFADGLEEGRVVGGDYDGDDEDAEDVEDDEAVDEAFGRPTDIPSRRLRLPSRNGDKFRSQHERESRSDETRPEGEEFPGGAEVWRRVAFEC